MLVDVALHRLKRLEYLTYQLEARQLGFCQPGQLVRVPVGQTERWGVVIDEPYETKPEQKILDPIKIKSLVTIGPMALDEVRLKLARWMAKTYLCTLSQAVFVMIPTPENMPKNLVGPAKMFELGGSFRKFQISAPIRDRRVQYKTMIEKTIREGRSVIVLEPTIEQVEDFARSLKRKVTIYHSERKNRDLWQAFAQSQTMGPHIIVGTREAVFVPVRRLGLIIVDEEQDWSYKSDRAPRFEINKTVSALAKLTKSIVCWGASTSSLSNYVQIKQHQITSIRQASPRRNLITIISPMSKFETFSPSVKIACARALAQGKPSLFFVPRKGEAAGLVCQNCRFVVLCQKCDLPATVWSKTLRCNHCSSLIEQPAKCPICKLDKLRKVGETTASVARRLENLSGKKTPITILESSQTACPSDPKGFVVSTSRVVHCPSLRFDLAVITGIDQILAVPDYNQNERIFRLITSIKDMADHLFIQTSLANHHVLTGLQQPERFYTRELKHRVEADFPPIVEMIKLTFEDSNQNTSQIEAQRVGSILHQKIGRAPHILLSQVHSPFFTKRRGRWRYQIILKIGPKADREKATETIKLLQLKYPWKIDIDPITLL